MRFQVIILFCFLLLFLVIHGVQGEEDEYYEDDPSAESEYEYEEEEDVAPVEQEQWVGQQQEQEEQQEEEVFESFYGFHRDVGSGLMKIKRPLVDEVYLNETALYYDCIKREDAWILAVEGNSTEEEEEDFDINKQIEKMKRKVNQAVQAANVLADGLLSALPGPAAGETSPDNNNNGTTTTTGTTPASEEKKKKKKRLSFREKQELRQKARREKEAEKERQRPKFRLGAACETLICGSCKAIVYEFAQAVDKAVTSSEVRYVEQVLTTNNFCSSKEISLKYIDMVQDICTNSFLDETIGYKEALITRFEQEESWEGLKQPSRVYKQQQDICVGIGACEEEDFFFQSEPEHYTQDQWDDHCFVCQAFADDLEERVQLTRHVTERSIVSMVRETCDRLQLEPDYQEVCKEMIEGKLLDDISWLAKVHGESIVRKAKGELKFSDKLCQEIDWCKPWMEPEKLKEKEVRETMEEVFF
eukprot:gene11106-12374_t